MNEQSPFNRIEAELNHWKSREERFNAVFSLNSSNSRSLLIEKLRQYERIAAKYRFSNNREEQSALRILKMETAQMTKMLYPNLLMRLLRKIIVNPLRSRISAKKDADKVNENSRLLHEEVQRIGFPDLSYKIKQQIETDGENFQIPVSYYINEKEKISNELSFSKGSNGQYYFDGFRSTLTNNLKPEESREHFFRNAPNLNFSLNNTSNLLSGRSVQHNGSWFQLDFNDRDIKGSYHLKEFRPGYGYDLEKAIKTLPFKKMPNQSEADKLKESLKQGAKVPVFLMQNGNEYRFYIEANPQFKSVNIYDQNSRKVKIDVSSNDKIQQAVKKIHTLEKAPKIPPGRKANSLSK